MAKSPVERTLAWLRELEIDYDISQSYNAHSRRRKDLFGIVDVVGLKMFCPPPRSVYKTLWIQVCADDWSVHVKKMLASRYAPLLCETGQLWLVGWSYTKKNGWASRTRQFKRGDYLNRSAHPNDQKAEIKPSQTFSL